MVEPEVILSSIVGAAYVLRRDLPQKKHDLPHIPGLHADRILFVD